MEQEGGCASSVSIWELGIKVHRGQLEPPIGVEELARRIEDRGVVELVQVDTEVWLRTFALDWSNRDPADRVIVAMAQLKQLPIPHQGPRDPLIRRRGMRVVRLLRREAYTRTNGLHHGMLTRIETAASVCQIAA
jgi:PIN domain nuclease of toxin-antitoxin system